ncbi:hypothetical protein [Kitasatospora sp. HPMI-4]|uniref:hypothetical protein n=1 Tax=Kitasatospora sp. HPMI-4 TaxID=3448443 RepID=UPI003F1E07D2
MIIDAREIAQRYIDNCFPHASLRDPADLRFSEDFCRAVADWYDRAPLYSDRPDEQREYRRFKNETNLQFRALREAHVRIEPWVWAGQPYSTSGDLRREFPSTGTLYVYLTANGHGPYGESTESTGNAPPPHPMRVPSAVTLCGRRLLENDLFRAVHDVFGHVVHGNSFSLEGELLATWDHMQMYSPECHRALLTETLCQICWFYCGPHIRRSDGSVPKAGDPDYVKPSKRPYSLQKTNLIPHEFVASFHSLFADR